MDSISVLERSREKYYNSGECELTDDQFDVLETFCEKTLNYTPTIGVIPNGIKIKLPVPMGSLKKMRNEDEVKSWKKSHNGPFYILDKLDGISCLLEYKLKDNDKYILGNIYSRGDGSYGTSLVHKVQNISIPNMLNAKHFSSINDEVVYIRGELVVDKNRWSVNSKKYSSPRVMASSICNLKCNDCEKLDFIAYQIISNHLIINEQLDLLESCFNTVTYNVSSDVNFKNLKELLDIRKVDSKYEIDGLVIVDETPCDPLLMIPRNKIAYKHEIDELKCVTVKEIFWNHTKSGYLVPTILFDPIKIGSTEIRKATGYNAKYIVNNKIGVGSKVTITKSSGIIPKILTVVEPVEFPTEGFTWCDRNLHFIDPEASKNAKFHTFKHFFESLSIKNSSYGAARFMQDNNFETVEDFLTSDLNSLKYGKQFTINMINSIKNAIIKTVNESTLEDLLVALYVFGSSVNKASVSKLLITKTSIERGIATHHVWLKVEPKIPIAINRLNRLLDICNAHKNDTHSDDVHMNDLHSDGANVDTLKKYKCDNKHQNICFSGFRDNRLSSKLIKKGYTIHNNITKSTDLLIVNSLTNDSQKLKKAKQYSIRIIKLADFLKNV